MKIIYLFLVIIVFVCCKNESKQENYYDTVVSPILKKETQAIDTLYINKGNGNLNVNDTIDINLLKSLKKSCKVFDKLFKLQGKIKAVSQFENGFELIDFGFDNSEKLPQAQGDPFLDLIVVRRNDSVKYFYISSVEKDDFLLLKSQDNYVIFTKYDSSVG